MLYSIDKIDITDDILKQIVLAKPAEEKPEAKPAESKPTAESEGKAESKADAGKGTSN